MHSHIGRPCRYLGNATWRDIRQFHDLGFRRGTTADLDSSTGFLLGFAYHYTDALEFGADFEFDEESYDASIASGTVPGVAFPTSGRIDNFRLMFNGTYNFLPGKFTPFVSNRQFSADVQWNL